MDTPERMAPGKADVNGSINAQHRYLLLANMYPSHEQPAYGTFIRNMEQALLERGCQIDRVVIAGRRAKLFGKLAAYSSYTVSALRQLLSNRHGLVYIHFISLSALPLLLCRPLFRGKVVFNAHGSDLLPDTSLKSAMLALMAPIIRGADLLVVPSNYYAEIARRRYPALEVFVSPSSGVDTRLFYAGEPPEPKRPGMLHVGFVSRIDHGKGWDTLLDALFALPPEIRAQLQVTIIGAGSEQDQMNARIRELELSTMVSWHGAMAQQDLASYYRAFDVLVFPSRRPAESLGLVGLEALCCGVPVIASDMAGPAGYISHGKNGWLIPPESSEALAEQLQLVLSMPPEQRQAHARAATETGSEYNRDVVADRLYNKLSEILEAHE